MGENAWNVELATVNRKTGRDLMQMNEILGADGKRM